MIMEWNAIQRTLITTTAEMGTVAKNDLLTKVKNEIKNVVEYEAECNLEYLLERMLLSENDDGMIELDFLGNIEYNKILHFYQFYN